MHEMLKPVFWEKLETYHHFTIPKIGLYNFDPLKPHFYIVKLGFTGVYIVFFFLFLFKTYIAKQTIRMKCHAVFSLIIVFFFLNNQNVVCCSCECAYLNKGLKIKHTLLQNIICWEEDLGWGGGFEDDTHSHISRVLSRI